MRLLKWIWNTLITLVILALVLILAFNLTIYVKRERTGDMCPTLFGCAIAVVTSGSMEPEIMTDDLVIILEQDEYELRDVITYRGNTYPVTHRVVGKRVDENGVIWYTTCGDANNKNDEEFSEDRVVGKIIYVVPGFGKAQELLQSPAGFFVLIMLLMAWLFVYEVKYYFRRKRHNRRR